MKHKVEIKLPKIFDRKLNISPEEEEKLIEERKEVLSKVVRIGGPIIIGLAIGYLAGYNRGITKLQRHKGDLYIIK